MKILLRTILVVAMIGLIIPSVYAATTTFDEGNEKIILEKTIDVNIILIGDSWLSSQVDSIKKDLVESYEPIYVLTGKKVGIKYNFDYNFLSVTEDDSKPAIPSWIRNNAGWWAEGQIDDDSFVQGIQFMIKENILSIPNLPETTSYTAESVPAWIKNNAGWWAEGQIDDDSFVKGIEYLVKVGIIQVS